jgi:hypothetical protein
LPGKYNNVGLKKWTKNKCARCFFVHVRITICSGFFRVLKTAVLSRVREGWGGCTSDKMAVFSTRTKNKVEKCISFFIGHEVLLYETAFSASALEH